RGPAFLQPRSVPVSLRTGQIRDECRIGSPRHLRLPQSSSISRVAAGAAGFLHLTPSALVSLVGEQCQFALAIRCLSLIERKTPVFVERPNCPETVCNNNMPLCLGLAFLIKT